LNVHFSPGDGLKCQITDSLFEAYKQIATPPVRLAVRDNPLFCRSSTLADRAGAAPQHPHRRTPTAMAQYVFTMNRVGKIVPPKRQILKNISLSFFPGAKIGVLGVNGSGKSTLLKIMAGVDKDIEGEAVPMPGLKIGYLEQEPKLESNQTVREAVEEGIGGVLAAKKRLDAVYAEYADEGADFDALAAEQAELEAVIAAAGSENTDLQLELAADALRLPPWR
jgi:energy-dependent translational throttle protein EttA